MRVAAALSITLLIVVAAARADSGAVLTAEGQQSGRIVFAADAVVVDEQPLAVSDLHGVVIKRTTASDSAPHAVQLRNGERWIVEIESLDRGKLAVSSPLIGRRTLATEAIQSIALSKPSTKSPRPAGKPGTLIRSRGEPIPGTLVWIDKQNVGLDSPLGVVALPREQVVMYRFPAADEPIAERTGDELELLDGTILRGRIALADGAVTIAHETFGDLRFPQPAVRRIRFSRPTVTWLDERAIAATAIDVFGRSIDQPAQRHAVDDALTAWRIPAHADVALSVQTDESPATLRGRLRVDSKPGVQLRITFTADDRTMGERMMAVGDSFDLSLPVSDAAAVQLAVRPGDQFALPAYLVMEDLRLVR